MKRRPSPSMTALLRAARPRIAWCMVGTAVYQVGRTSSNCWKMRRALKPGAQWTDAPARMEALTAAISPWMWNSGMMFRHRSAGFSASEAAICPAEAARLAPDKGTIFGREVVPEVCSTRAMSSGSAGGAASGTEPPTSRLKLPAGPLMSSASSIRVAPCFSATARAGVSSPAATITAFAFRSEM